MSRASVLDDLGGLVEAAALLIGRRLTYEQAMRDHFARLLRCTDRSRIGTFDDVHRAYV